MATQSQHAFNSALTKHIDVALAPTGISVSAANGRVTLFGMTSSGGLRARAEMLAQAIGDVSYIEHRIISGPNRGRSFLTNHGRLP
jgi:osmotically-inducible protein OsmY